MVVLSIGGLSTLFLRPASGCPPVLRQPVARSVLSSSSFGAITAFSIPGAVRWPNAIAAAPDGSVWFGEEAVPGLAHLYPSNGTLVEYTFPGLYQTDQQGTSCSGKTQIWGVAIWNGRIWATDSAKNRILGLSPSNDSFKAVPLSVNGSFPYTFTPGPEGALWFTQPLSGQVGTLFANGSLVEHTVHLSSQLPGSSVVITVHGEPDQVVFANDTMGFYVDASPLAYGSAIYRFDPANFNPERVGASNQTLYSPDSLSLGDGGIWLAQHGDSSLAFYELQTGRWTVYPTSSVGYIGTTLPYFVKTNGSLIWFNEHYANRIAVMDFQSKTLTEYSVSDPPATSMPQTNNPLTFALSGGRVWFTELTGNKVAFVDGSYRPSFSLSVNGTSSISLRRGANATLGVDLIGASSSPLSLVLSGQGVAHSSSGNVTMHADMQSVESLNGTLTVAVNIGVSPGAAAGKYTLLVTATDGLISRSAYVELSVLP